jgi:hypothetical protein
MFIEDRNRDKDANIDVDEDDVRENITRYLFQ